ncbi:hypothetical protein FACS1894190_01870 [Spirochaetia bacterium]|nr:hypothetical protein FACS1894190_01870 [Spirochaetia bacterium]
MQEKEKNILMEVQQISLEKRLEMLSEKQRMYVQGYLDGILQVYKPLKWTPDLPKATSQDNLNGGQPNP